MVSPRIGALLRGSPNAARDAAGVAVVSEQVLDALARDGRPSSRPLFGFVERSGGRVFLRAESLDASAGFTCIGALVREPEQRARGHLDEAGEAAYPGGLRLVLEEGRAARAPGGLRAELDGAPLEVVLRDPSRYRDRLAGVLDAERLESTSVVLVGLGSVGSEIGARLARLGVHVTGLDPDVLTMENLIRWGLPASADADVGRCKADVWSSLLRATVPGARVEPHAVDVVREAATFDATVAKQRPDLLIVATDTADSRRAANAAAARHGVPALFVALADGAASVRIEWVADARRGPCHLCSTYAEAGSEALAAAGRASRTPYAADAAPLASGVPALPIDVALGALVAARFAVVLLSGGDATRYFARGEQRGTVLFMSLRPDWWLFDEPWDRLVYQPDRNPDCPACAGHAESAGGEAHHGR